MRAAVDIGKLVCLSKFPELLAGELKSIVCDEFVWNPIMCKLAFQSCDDTSAGAVIQLVKFSESQVVVNKYEVCLTAYSSQRSLHV